MSAPQHTPGPWSVSFCSQGEGCWCRIISIAGREESDSLDDCVIASGAVNKRDAHLIAAAPELFEALEYITTYHKTGGHEGDPDEAERRAEAALAKARGEVA